jgi:hypothetical protein
MSDGRLNLSFDAFHDADAHVWVATSAQGRMTTEAPSREALIERALYVACFRVKEPAERELSASAVL